MSAAVESTFNVVGRLRLWGVLCIFVLCSLQTGCGGKQRFEGGYPNNVPGVCSDLRNIPQDLQYFATQAGAQRHLVNTAEQNHHAQKLRSQYFAPWRMQTPSPSLKHSFNSFFYVNPKERYLASGVPFPENKWAVLAENCAVESYPSCRHPAIIVHNTDLRAMPTHEPLYRDPSLPGEGHPFDYFQHSAVWVGTPVFAVHSSRDGEWMLVETRHAAGWVPRKAVAFVDREFIDHWSERPLAALTMDNIILSQGSAGIVKGHIGTLLPLTRKGHKFLIVACPIKESSEYARMVSVELPVAQVTSMPLALTPANVAKVGNRMLFQPYGWGGVEENRDCSALMRDLFATFGFWLPRNSSQQAIWGRPVFLQGLTPEEKEIKIRADAIPFLSLIWLRGHIGLYVGEFKGKPVIYHSIWGLRVRDTPSIQGMPSQEGRIVIGMTVLTSLRPGAELERISSPASLLDRIERVSILPEVADKVPLVQKQNNSRKTGKKTVPVLKKKRTKLRKAQ